MTQRFLKPLTKSVKDKQTIRDVLLFPAMRPEAPVAEAPLVDPTKQCKKCGHDIIEELKPAKKGKGMFCIDGNACKARASNSERT